MEFYPVAIEKLIEEFAKLPSIGKKSAQRLTLHILNLPKQEELLNIVLYVVILQIQIHVQYVQILIEKKI